jgi:hypothetical protein
MRTYVRMGEAGHVSAKFRRALDAGNFEVARMLAWELPHIGLPEALILTLLAAEAEPPIFEPMARRWLARLLEEVGPPPDDFAIAAQIVADVAGGRLPSSKALAPLARAAEGKRLG